MSAVLNLGAGKRIVDGAINHDRVKHHDRIDVAHDLNVLPWPWLYHSFDEVIALSVFEHLDHDLFASLNEVHRVLIPGGILTIKLPLQSAWNAYDDPSHRWLFTIRSLDQFCPETTRGLEYDFYTPFKWAFVERPAENDDHTSMWSRMRTI